jgi:putative ABC transport system permease protein
MALGARGHDVVRGFVGRGMALAGLGVAVGVAISAAVTRLMESILFRVSPLDPVIFLLAAVAALAVAGVAAWAPARRASAVDPMVALRQE